MPSAYPDISAALEWLGDKRIGPRATVTIQVANGGYTHAEAIVVGRRTEH